MSVVKTKTKALPKKEKEEQIKKVLSQVVGDQTNKIINDLNIATKGKPILHQTIIVKKQ